MSDTTHQEPDAAQHETCIISVSALQKRLRELFQEMPPARAMVASLEVIGEYFDGVYMVLHAGLGTRLLSEEWYWDEFEPAEALRESVNDSMANVMSIEAARCVRMGPIKDSAPAVMAAPIFDSHLDLAGAASLVVGPCSRNDAFKILSQFEGIVGYLSLLASDETAVQKVESQDGDIVIPEEARKASDSPLYLAYAMAAHLKNRHSLDQVIIGFVDHHSVRVVAVCGIDEVRASNPGIKLIRASMEECLDRDAPILYPGFLVAPEANTVRDDCRLHVQWSRSVGGDAVASLPIKSGDKTVAIVSIRADHTIGLSEGHLEQYSAEMAGYSSFVPISNLARRSLLRHCADSMSSKLQKIFKRDWQRYSLLSAIALLLCWVLFGTMSYSFTVPSTIRLANPRTISSPREGVLASLLVRPGDRVKKGALLATLDTAEDRLTQVQLEAEAQKYEAMIDRAMGEGKPGDRRVLLAQRNETEARLALVLMRLEQSEIRAPSDGILMTGDLRSRIGAKLSLGEPMFELAPDGRVQIELKIPENQIWDSREAVNTTFAASARPAEWMTLTGLSIHPSSIPDQGKNVFLAETEVLIAPDHLSPGMEGVVNLEIGDRPVWWVMTHRIVDWMRLRFWF